jgi:hypothetical protein
MPSRSTWFIVPAIFSFLVYVVTMVGETNRLPFDLAEGEGEIVGGFHTEYGSMRFAMFFLAEYINMFSVSALATTMFLGGWQAPPFISAIGDGILQHRLVGFALVHPQGVVVHVLLRLAARLVASRPLRPVHAAGLETAHPTHPGVGCARRLHACGCAGLVRWLGRRDDHGSRLVDRLADPHRCGARRSVRAGRAA